MAGERVIRKEMSGYPELPTLNPQTLIQGNYAFSVLDKDIYERMAGPNFRPSVYEKQRAQVIRVENPESRRGFDYLVIDGHHRVKAAQSYIEWSQSPEAKGDSRANPEYELKVFDLTDELSDKHPGRTHFTPEQALKEIIQPTKAHETIATHRIAAHILTEWDKNFQSSPASHYSVLATLFLVNGAAYPKKGEDVDARIFLSDAHHGISMLVKESQSGFDDIVYNAFRTIATLDESPDNPDAQENREAKQRQVNGFMQLSTIDDKVRQGRPNETVLAGRQEELSSLLYSAFVKTSSSRGENRAFRQVIADTNLTYDELVSVLRSPGDEYVFKKETGDKDKRLLSVRYEDVKYSKNLNNIAKKYSNEYSGDSLSPWEYMLAGSLCRGKNVLDVEAISDRVAAVRSTRVVFDQADKFIRGLDVVRSQFPPESAIHAVSTLLMDERYHLASVRSVDNLEKVRDNLSTLITVNKNIIAVERTKYQGPAEPVTVYEAPQPRTDTEIVEEFSRLLDRDNLADEVVAQLGPLARKIAKRTSQTQEGEQHIDWNKVLINTAKDGSGSWYILKLEQGKKAELREQDKRKNTRIIDNNVREIFSKTLGGDLDVILSTVQDSQGNTGLDAIHSSLSNRLARIASKLKWDKSSSQFKFLCASHYLLSAQIAIDQLKNAETLQTITSDQNALLEKLLPAKTKFETRLREYTASALRAKSKSYLELLQYALYMPYDELEQVFKYFAANNSNVERETSLIENLKTKPHQHSVESLFRKTVLEVAA